jgi:hypothetical protein
LASTKDVPLKKELGTYNELPVKASTKIFEGSAVGLVSGYARNLVAGDQFVGFAEKQADNSSGADAAIDVRLMAEGKVEKALSSVAVTDVGAPVFASADDTFTLTATGNSLVGVVHRKSATDLAIIKFNALADYLAYHFGS